MCAKLATMIEEFSPAEYAQRRDSGELWQLLDVREPWEVRLSSVAEAVYIPMGEIPLRHKELDSQRRVAVMCHSGGRSVRVANYLAQNGFATVANTVGGIDAWAVEVDDSIPRY